MNSREFKSTCVFLLKKIIELEKTECCMCLEKIEVGTLLLPCNHYQVCFNCVNELQECPLCRSKIKNIVNYNNLNDSSVTNFYEHVLGKQF